jgi:hypothetical protein
MEVLLEIGKLLKDALGHNRAHDARLTVFPTQCTVLLNARSQCNLL